MRSWTWCTLPAPLPIIASASACTCPSIRREERVPTNCSHMHRYGVSSDDSRMQQHAKHHESDGHKGSRAALRIFIRAGCRLNPPERSLCLDTQYLIGLCRLLFRSCARKSSQEEHPMFHQQPRSQQFPFSCRKVQVADFESWQLLSGLSL